MGQTSISMLNKVGYSMFWNSMWDNKINYSLNLKEDIFLKLFFKYTFNDNTSFKYSKLFSKNKKKYNYKFNIKNNDKNLLFVNKIVFYSSKLWIIKYQKWVIIYNFIYIPNFNELSTKQYNFRNLNHKGLGLANIFKLYTKSTIKTKIIYNFFKNSV